MSKALLVTRPRHDVTTYYLYHWTAEIIKEAKKKGFKLLDLSKRRANKKVAESMLRKMQPLLVFLNGHGSSDCVTGHNNQPMIKKSENSELLESKIIYARSCQSGKELGPDCIENGACAYIGYTENFVLCLNEDKTRRPLEDSTAELFLGPSNQVMVSLLKGHSAENANSRSKVYFLKNIQKVINSDSSEHYLAAYLYHDMKNQVCLGDGSSCV